MTLPVRLLRQLLWRRRVAAALAWQRAARAQAAEHDDAIRRILDQSRTIR
jgi:hypothetical protein